jgi:hypothetical protein
MPITSEWIRESGARVEASRALDSLKVQAPGVVANPQGGWRLFYTGIGSGKPFPACQGYILSATSMDGINFAPEPGIRVQPDPARADMSRRVLAPSIAQTAEGNWRMYFEARGVASRPYTIGSAVSDDQLAWQVEPGSRLQAYGGVGGPRYVELSQGGGRLFCWAAEYDTKGPGYGQKVANGVISATSADGVSFALDAGRRLAASRAPLQSGGVTAAAVVPPGNGGDRWSMVYSAWQDVPSGTVVPPHPSTRPETEGAGASEDFAALSIASDLAGFRSRLFVAYSDDGLSWEPGVLALAGRGYDTAGIDAVHAEDMSLADLGNGRFRVYYAACDTAGDWRIASAVSG